MQVYTCLRSFIGKTQAYVPDMPVNMRQLIVRWAIALPYAMRTHLLDYKPGSDALQELLRPDEVILHHLTRPLLWLCDYAVEGCLMFPDSFNVPRRFASGNGHEGDEVVTGIIRTFHVPKRRKIALYSRRIL